MHRITGIYRATAKRLVATGALLGISSLACAGEIPQAVKDACAGDYKKYCSMHAPESDNARNCMAKAFSDLSNPCVSAILDSDLPDEQTAEVKTPDAGDGSVGPGDVRSKNEDTAAAAAASGAQHVATKAKSAPDGVVARKAKPAAKRVALRRQSKHHRQYADAGRRDRPARIRSGGNGKVARYINRGTRIANFYATKYTQRAFAKVFR